MTDWTVKYAPKSLHEVMGNSEAVRAFHEYINNPESMPHLMLDGFTGTGKTTMVRILVDSIIGDQKMNIKEMNASNDRGIDTIRKEIISFMRYVPWGDVPFKILVLDEADAITREAQECLKAPLEKYKHNCRVIFLCNDGNKIIPEIRLGRCTVFQFKPLKERDIVDRLKYILNQEGINNGFDLELIYRKSGGSMRAAIAILQQMVQSKSNSGESEIDEIEKIIKAYSV